MPRLNRKTNPKAIEAEEEGDFEEELKAYKEGAFSAPSLVRQAVKRGISTKEIKPERQVKADMRNEEAIHIEQDRNQYKQTSLPSSSTCPEALSDTQAVALSDVLLNTQETEEYWQDLGEGGLRDEAPNAGMDAKVPTMLSWEMDHLLQKHRGTWYYDLRYGEPPIESGQSYGWAQQQECEEFFAPPETWWN